MIKTENIRLIALDLDDTTLRHDSRLDSETKAAICRALDAGIEVVIASGRAFNSLPGEVCAIKGIRYAITSNCCRFVKSRRAHDNKPCAASGNGCGCS